MLERWHSQDCLLHPNYDYVEDVLMVRCRLLRLAMSREKQHGGETGMTSTVHSALTHHLITYARKAREARRHQVTLHIDRQAENLGTFLRGQVAPSLKS